MTIQIGINGFGRIGRLVLRVASLNSQNFKIVGINAPFVNAEYMAYMLKYDSVHGGFTGEIKTEENTLIVSGQKIKIFAEKEPQNIPWGARRWRLYSRIHRCFLHY